MPTLVERAVDGARRAGFPLTRAEAGPDRASASLPQVGRLLATLVAARPGGRIAEMGTGAGIGAAWMASALVDGATLVTVEADAELAQVAAALFEDRDDVTVVHGDSHEVLSPLAPFDLVFVDCGGDRAHAVDLLAVGGQLVMDDLTTVWVGPDPKRELAFGDPRLVAVEVMTTATDAAIIATRVATS